MWRAAVLIQTILIAGLASAQAEQADAEYERLIAAETLRCLFDEGHGATWNEDGAVASESRGPFGPLVFDSIEILKGTARLIGNAGAEDVTVILSLNGLTFVEQTPTGSLNITTVYAEAVETLGTGLDVFMAVTSRHIAINFVPLPSQYYGSCRVVESRSRP